jgi:pantoate--beta-alanine ligase
MRLARQRCDLLVVSIYVNPKQFGPNEDLSRYPRDPEGDAAKCAAEGTDVIFLPDDLYGTTHRTLVAVRDLTAGLCGAIRPGHFDGVTTVVARLFGFAQPHLAVFGEKDFQQLAVIRRMTADLAMPIEIVGGPLVRDHDGLALSSRNTYLSVADRQRALSLHRALFAIAKHPSASAAERIDAARSMLDVDRLDYLTVVDPDTLQPVERVDSPARALVAGLVGKTRLIDNVAVSP